MKESADRAGENIKGAFQRNVCDWWTLKMKSQALYKKIENINIYGKHHYTQSRPERIEKSQKIAI